MTQGYAVEMLRSCYVSQWRLPGAQAPPVWGYYCFTPEGTPVFPGPHYVGSLNWVTDDRGPNEPPLGEVDYNKATNPRPWWSGVCSPGPPNLDIQGVELDGTAAAALATAYVAEGGGEFNGTAEFRVGFHYVAEGGFELSSEWPVTQFVAEGGGELDGSAEVENPPDPHFPQQPFGVELDGRGDKPLETVYYAEGGLELDGRGDKPLETEFTADGGIELDGRGDVPFAAVPDVDGGIELDGRGDVPFSIVAHVDGGIELDGDQGVLRSTVHTDGGVEFGNAVLPPTGSVITLGLCDGLTRNKLYAKLVPIGGPWGTVGPITLTYDDVALAWKGTVGVGGGYSPMNLTLTYTAPFGESGLWLITSIPSIPWDFANTPLGGETVCNPFRTRFGFPYFDYAHVYGLDFFFHVYVSEDVATLP